MTHRNLRRGAPLVMAFTLMACSFGAESSPRTIPDGQRGTLSIGFGSPLSLDGEVQMYLPRLDVADGTKLGSVARPLDEADVETLLLALVRTLVAGPTAEERALGFGTAIPDGTRVIDVSPAANRITIDLSGPIATLAPDRLIVALSQIVYTLTEGFFAREVVIKVDGESIMWPRQDGSLTENPLTIFDYPTAVITSQPAYPGIISTDASV